MTHPFHRRPGISPRRRFYFLNRLASVLAVIALTAAGTTVAGTATPPSEWVLVTDVVDGDTIKVLRGRREETVRLIGVDTPETNKQGTPVQFYGPEASLFTRRALLEKRVRLEFEPPDRQGGRRDKYQRALAYVFTDDGRNFNLQLIKQGFGRAYTRYPFEYEQTFTNAERAARAARRGIWNEAKRAAWSDPARRGGVIGNIRTNIYHVPGQRYYDSIGEKNRLYFQTEEEAHKAGFRKARH
jgi:micrococcal nuclease